MKFGSTARIAAIAAALPLRAGFSFAADAKWIVARQKDTSKAGGWQR